MAATAKIISVGNSAGVILPKETLARLNIKKGDTVYITEGSQGVRLMPYDPKNRSWLAKAVRYRGVFAVDVG